MILPFVANPPRIGEDGILRAARSLDVEPAMLKAVIEVEAAGSGFLADGRPKVRFERHYFRRLTEGRFDKSHPHLSGGAKSFPASGEWARLEEAMTLDREAALKSASWGAGQIMGANHAAAGFATVELFAAAMCGSEHVHLLAVAEFLRSKKLHDAMRRHDWRAVAVGYNGPSQRGYDRKLAAAYARHVRKRLLRRGDVGPDVRALQSRLGIDADGAFGALTEEAVRRFQQAHGLAADGIAGPLTLARLNEVTDA